MQIGIDARIAFYNSSGIRRYISGLVKGLCGITHPHSFSLYQSWRERSPIIGDKAFSYPRLYSPSHCRFERYTLALELAYRNDDLLHAMDFFIPLPQRAPLICSVYDLYFLRDPETLDRESRRHYLQLPSVLENAAHVICPSEATRQDLCQFCGINRDKATVIYPGYQTPITSGNLGHKAEPHFLFVGTIEPRKNLKRLCSAYSIAKERSGGRLPPLFIVGRKGFRANEVMEHINALSLSTSLSLLGEVPEHKLSELYQSAISVLYPSLWEGFGFPILEAMSSGVPVLTSDCSSMSEIAGDAALLVNPHDVDDIADGILSLAQNREQRQELAARGRARAAEFSWTACAKSTLEVYELLGKAI